MAEATENGNSPVQDENTAPDTTQQQNEEKENGEKKDTNGEMITVFHDPENFNVKHPLMHEWTLWFTKPPSGKVRFSRDSLSFPMLTVWR